MLTVVSLSVYYFSGDCRSVRFFLFSHVVYFLFSSIAILFSQHDVGCRLSKATFSSCVGTRCVGFCVLHSLSKMILIIIIMVII